MTTGLPCGTRQSPGCEGHITRLSLQLDDEEEIPKFENMNTFYYDFTIFSGNLEIN